VAPSFNGSGVQNCLNTITHKRLSAILGVPDLTAYLYHKRRVHHAYRKAANNRRHIALQRRFPLVPVPLRPLGPTVDVLSRTLVEGHRTRRFQPLSGLLSAFCRDWVGHHHRAAYAHLRPSCAPQQD
jgi:hypothetical protein